MLIEIVSDTICPWCYLGKRRLERALAARPEVSAAVHWLPFELNPDMPAAGVDHTAHLAAKFGSVEAVQAARQRLVELGAAEGIAYRFDRIRVSPNTRASHALVHAAAAIGRQDALQEALFCAYFVEGLDIGDLQTLVDIGARHGLDPVAIRRRLESREDWGFIEAEAARARQAGVSGVPFFVFDGRYAISGAQEVATFERVLDEVVATAEA